MQGAAIDWRYAARSLRRQPAFTCFAALVLAIGIASVATMVAVVDAIEFPALPFQNPRRIVIVERLVTSPNDPTVRLRPATTALFLRFQSAHTISDVAAQQYVGNGTIAGDGGNVMVTLNAATPNYFAMLGLRPLVGRFFTPGDTMAGAPPVIVLTFDFWKRQFGGRTDALGKTVRLTPGDSGAAPANYTVIGVLPSGVPEFTGERGIGQFVPLSLGADDAMGETARLTVFARLRSGVTITAAQQELSHLAHDEPGTSSERTVGIEVRRFDSMFGYLAPARFSLLAIAALVLAMAALNVATLILARAASHAQETALRIAIGASTFRILRQFVAESVIITALGSIVAVPLAVLGSRTVSTALGLAQGGWRVSPDAGVLGAVACVIAVVSLACALPPSIAAARQGAHGIIRGVGHVLDAHATRRRLTDGLLIAQLAGALTLVFGAGLIAREFHHAAYSAPGMDASHVLEVSFPVGLPHATGPDALPRMLAALTGLPGARSAGIVTVTGDDTVLATSAVGVASRVPIEDDAVSAGTMRTLSVVPVAGRLLDSADFASSAPVVVVNDVLADAIWPNGSPVGKSMTVIRPPSNAPLASGVAGRQVVTIVGVVHPLAINYAPGNRPPAQIFRQFVPSAPADAQWLYVRTSKQPVAAAAEVRRAIESVDAADFFSDAVQPVQAQFDSDVAGLRFAARSLSLGALLAIVVASLGIYGLVAYTVSRRARDIAIRRALGASAWRSIQFVAARAAWVAAFGIVSGGLGCVAMARILTHLNPDAPILSLDVGSLVSSALCVVLVVAVASFVPAYRAANAGTAALRSA